jgi:hypothetical protein
MCKTLLLVVAGLFIGCGDEKGVMDEPVSVGLPDCGDIVYGVGCPGSGDPHAQATCMVGDRNDVPNWKPIYGCTTTFRLIADPSMTYQTLCVASCEP